MKKILLSTLLAVTSVFSFSSLHAATTTSSMDVNATIQNVCYLKTLMDVHFDYSPLTSSNLTRSVPSAQLLDIKCTGEFIPQLHVSGASNPNRELIGADNHKLKYILEFTDHNLNPLDVQPDDSLLNSDIVPIYAAGQGQNFTFDFTIPKGQFVKGQNYSETITITLSY